MKNDPKLHETLQAWRVSPPAPAGFNAGVWRRIAAEEDRGWTGLCTRLGDWLLVQLPRPAFASALLAATAALGVAAASLQAGHMREHYRQHYARQYLNSIDPLAMVQTASDQPQ